MPDDDLTLSTVAAHCERIAPWILETPLVVWPGGDLASRLGRSGAPAEIRIKLELLQRTGTFKARGALTHVLALDEAARGRGVTAVSAGNHAIATVYAGAALGAQAKVVMLGGANPSRVARCRGYGAEIVFADDVHAAFERVAEIEREEGRYFVHPYEGYRTVLGTATLGYELARQWPDCEAVVIPVGGGGLAAGMSSALKQALPEVEIYGVEPSGADNMRASFAAGEPMRLERVRTIADSLGPPMSLPYTYALCRRHLDDVVTVEDEALRDAMRLIFEDTKFAVEPACAASTAALLGPLRERLAGRRTALVFCGSNIDSASFCRLAGRDA